MSHSIIFLFLIIKNKSFLTCVNKLLIFSGVLWFPPFSLNNFLQSFNLKKFSKIQKKNSRKIPKITNYRFRFIKFYLEGLLLQIFNCNQHFVDLLFILNYFITKKSFFPPTKKLIILHDDCAVYIFFSFQLTKK